LTISLRSDPAWVLGTEGPENLKVRFIERRNAIRAADPHVLRFEHLAELMPADEKAEAEARQEGEDPHVGLQRKCCYCARGHPCTLVYFDPRRHDPPSCDDCGKPIAVQDGSHRCGAPGCGAHYCRECAARRTGKATREWDDETGGVQWMQPIAAGLAGASE